jgi:ADP-ribosylglycohydrolase
MEAIAAARVALLGTSVGDAFGTMVDGLDARHIAKRLISMKRPWQWTDDTAMAISIVEVLASHGAVDPDALAALFAERYAQEPNRGYGLGTASLLTKVGLGAAWEPESRGTFGGKGSFGNGAAMRAAPIGAYFAPDLERVRSEAIRSALPTHTHPDGVAGAVAVAIAAALARDRDRTTLLAEVVRWTPTSRTRDGIARAGELGLEFDVTFAGEELGTGANITAHDTVPFALWCAARHLDSYETAMWTVTAHPGLEVGANALALSAFDRDTLGAITGGIVASAVGEDGIPFLWRAATERLPL